MENIYKEISELKTFIKVTEREINKNADAWAYADYLTGQINVAKRRIERLQDEITLKLLSKLWKT